MKHFVKIIHILFLIFGGITVDVAWGRAEGIRIVQRNEPLASPYFKKTQKSSRKNLKEGKISPKRRKGTSFKRINGNKGRQNYKKNIKKRHKIKLRRKKNKKSKKKKTVKRNKRQKRNLKRKKIYRKAFRKGKKKKTVKRNKRKKISPKVNKKYQKKQILPPTVTSAPTVPPEIMALKAGYDSSMKEFEEFVPKLKDDIKKNHKIHEYGYDFFWNAVRRDIKILAENYMKSEGLKQIFLKKHEFGFNDSIKEQLIAAKEACDNEIKEVTERASNSRSVIMGNFEAFNEEQYKQLEQKIIKTYTDWQLALKWYEFQTKSIVPEELRPIFQEKHNELKVSKDSYCSCGCAHF